MTYVYFGQSLTRILYKFAEDHLKQGKDWDVVAVDSKRDIVVYRRLVEDEEKEGEV